MPDKVRLVRNAWRAALGFLLLGVVLVLSVGTVPTHAATPPEPTYGAATVDGSIAEWDLDTDYFADMYRAGNPLKQVESKLYLRYDCATNTLYALVRVPDDLWSSVTVLAEPDNAFVKLGNAVKLVDGNSGNDGTPPDFAWVEWSDNTARGFEASAPLSPGSYANLNVHVQVDDGGSQTSAVADRAIDLLLQCPAEEPRICVDKTPLVDNVNPPVTIPYRFHVCNPGTVPLAGVTLTDPICDAPPQYQGGDDSPSNGLLDPGEVWEYRCDYTFGGPGVPGVCVVNTVVASGTYNSQTATDQHPGVVHCEEPPVGESSIQIMKTADLEHACPGQTLLYRYEVSNPGETQLSDIVVQDDRCGGLIGPDPDGDNNPPNGLLDPGETWVYICRYVIKSGEPNPLENRVRVIGAAAGPPVVADGHPAIVQIVPCPQAGFVPEPGTVMLLTTGLAGVASYVGFRVRRRLHR